MRGSVLFILALVCIWSLPVDCQDCTRHITCGACISQEGCAWCYEEGFSGRSRCQLPGNLTGCNTNFIENPSSSEESRTVSTIDLRTISFDRIRLRLRVGDPQTFTVTVTPQPNLPLDLYILIDLSESMLDELQTVQSIASQIADRVSSVTNNVRLGFGSFIEKTVQPFVQLRLDGAVTDDRLYAFRHTIDLTSNSTAFSEQVQAIGGTIANVDLPENGLEGLAQVITCEDIIGWRERVDGIGTRLVLFMTDQEFHFAGEGRLAGIVKPYNGKCLLEPNPSGGPVEFTRTNEFDYPSVGQILELLQENDVTTIFAIAQGRIASYETLVNSILNANSVVRAAVQGFTITSGGSEMAQTEILSIITEQYQRLLQGVFLDTSRISTDTNTDVDVLVEPTCPLNTTAEQVRDGCAQVPLSEEVSFDVTLRLNSCEGLEDGQVFRHNVTTASFGSFLVEFEVVCDCGCADSGVRVPGNCSDVGVRSCGVCECDEGRCGVDCSQVIEGRNGTDCPVAGVNSLVCSGPERGMCDCTCICTSPNIFGDACECDDFRCPGTTPVCSGRGMCCDGRCICEDTPQGPYRGEAGQLSNCQCEPEERVCIDPTTRLLCNDRGTCGCNFCTCTNTSYTGIFCDLRDISTCNFVEDEACIRVCRDRFDEASLPDICTECSPTRPLLFVFRQDIASSLTLSLEMITNARLSEGQNSFSFVRGACNYEQGNCLTEYYILDNETHYALVAVRELDCTPFLNLAIPVWALAPIILGCLLILGILLVILVKIIFTILDYIEVKKWQKEAQAADFSKNTNPLYQSPEMKYENVAYGKE